MERCWAWRGDELAGASMNSSLYIFQVFPKPILCDVELGEPRLHRILSLSIKVRFFGEEFDEGVTQIYAIIYIYSKDFLFCLFVCLVIFLLWVFIL